MRFGRRSSGVRFRRAPRRSGERTWKPVLKPLGRPRSTAGRRGCRCLRRRRCPRPHPRQAASRRPSYCPVDALRGRKRRACRWDRIVDPPPPIARRPTRGRAATRRRTPSSHCRSRHRRPSTVVRPRLGGASDGFVFAARERTGPRKASQRGPCALRSARRVRRQGARSDPPSSACPPTCISCSDHADAYKSTSGGGGV